MNLKKEKQLKTILSQLYQANVVDDPNDVYIIETNSNKVTQILNLLGSIGGFFEYSPVTDEEDNVVEYHIIIKDYVTAIDQ